MQAKYQRMIHGLKARLGKARNKKTSSWYLYMLRCRDGSLYTGITNNIEKRFKMHATGKGARYTRSRRPVSLVYQEKCKGRSAALVREFEVKRLSKNGKEALPGFGRKTVKILKQDKVSNE